MSTALLLDASAVLPVPSRLPQDVCEPVAGMPKTGPELAFVIRPLYWTINLRRRPYGK